MPNYTRYLTPNYVVGELNRIIGGQPDVIEVIKQNSYLICTALNAGLGEAMFPNSPGIDFKVNVRSEELDEVSRVENELFDLGKRIGTDLSDDLENNHLSNFDTYPFCETVLSYVFGYFNPDIVEGFRRRNRRSENAHLLPPEKNVN